MLARIIVLYVCMYVCMYVIALFVCMYVCIHCFIAMDLQSGKDSKKLKELLAKKADLQAKVDTLYAEYEELLTLVK